MNASHSKSTPFTTAAGKMEKETKRKKQTDRKGNVNYYSKSRFQIIN